MAANQMYAPGFIGFSPSASYLPALSAQALNAAATWLALGFIPEQAKTLDNVRAYESLLNGVVLSANFTCECQTDSGAGLPSGSIVSGGGPQGATTTLASTTWIQWDGFTASLTAGAQYWLVFKNTQAVPGTNYPTLRYHYGVWPRWLNGGADSSPVWGWMTRLSTNSGVGWAAFTIQDTAGYRIGYSDSTYDGLPFSAIAASSTGLAYRTSGSASFEVGFKATTPANATLKVKGIHFVVTNGTGVGPLKFRLYSGSSTSACTLTAETATIPTGNIGANVPITLYFTSPVQLTGGTVIRCTLADTSSTGTNTKYFVPIEMTLDTGSYPSALLAFDGTMTKCHTVNGASAVGNSPGSAFTDVAVGTFAQFGGLVLDTNGEFAASGGGGAAELVSSGGLVG